jgi:hypothetical protein
MTPVMVHEPLPPRTPPAKVRFATLELPVADKEPPATTKLPCTVRLWTVTFPLERVTVTPDGITTSSPGPGRTPPLQLADVFQSPEPGLLQVTVFAGV